MGEVCVLKTTLSDIESMCQAKARDVGVEIAFSQSNHEGALIDAIHGARGEFNGILLNAGAYPHTSIGLMDAISSAGVPVVELHLSNIHAREEFRHKSYVAPVAVGQICGFGAAGYPLAIDAMLAILGEGG